MSKCLLLIIKLGFPYIFHNMCWHVPPPFMWQLSLLKNFSNETKRKNYFCLVQESELGIEAAEKRLAGIRQIFGLKTEEEKAANFFKTFAYLFHFLLFYSLSQSEQRG